MSRKHIVTEIKCTRFDVCKNIEEMDDLNKIIGQAFYSLTDHNDPESVKQMNRIKQQIRDYYKNGFIYYLDTVPVFDQEGKLSGEGVTMIYVTEFGMDVQVINDIRITLVKPKQGYYTFDLITKRGNNINPQVVLFFDREPDNWYEYSD